MVKAVDTFFKSGATGTIDLNIDRYGDIRLKVTVTKGVPQNVTVNVQNDNAPSAKIESVETVNRYSVVEAGMRELCERYP